MGGGPEDEKNKWARHAYNPSPPEAEAEGWLDLRPASSEYVFWANQGYVVRL